MPTGGWAGLWNRVGGTQHDLLIPRGHTHARKFTNVIRRGIGGIIASERVFTNYNEDTKQVVAAPVFGPVSQGGVVSIAVNNLTPVTSANFIAYVEKPNAPVTYPRDLSGNGGGGKLGTRL